MTERDRAFILGMWFFVWIRRGGREGHETENALTLNLFCLSLEKKMQSYVFIHVNNILKGKRNAYSLWMLFVSNMYCLCKWICVWNVKYSYLNILWYISLQTDQVFVAS